MTFIHTYSRKLLSTRQKILLTATVSVCVAAFVYTYLATEFITNALLVSVADSSAHVRLFIPADRERQIDSILAEIRKMPQAVRADQGVWTENEYWVVARKQPTEIGKPGEEYYSGAKRIQIVSYPFDSVSYIPPVLMENVYSASNRERMERKPEDEPVRIITDLDERESLQPWVIVNSNLTSIFPLGPSCFGNDFEVSLNDAQGNRRGAPLVTAGYLTDNPLIISDEGYRNNLIYTKPALLEKLSRPEDRKRIIDISLFDRLAADQIKESLQSRFSLEHAESWIDRNQSTVPFLNGLKNTAYFGVGFIVLMSIIGISVVIAMLVIDKTRQLAVLYALGLNAFQLRLLFLYIGIRVVVFATFFGGGLAVLGAQLSLPWWRQIVENFCRVPEMSLTYSPMIVLCFPLLLLALCSAAAWLPTRSLVYADPVHNLRIE